jgi:hypothetical protein
MLFPGTDNWRAGMQDMAAAANETMGELVHVTPATAKPNYPSMEDLSKTVTVTAVFTNKARTVMLGNEGKIGGLSVSPLLETSEPIFQFNYGTLPFHLQQGYRITRCCNGARYEVTNVKPDGVAFVFAKVVQLGRPGREG